MKKIFVLLIAAALILSLTACGATGSDNKSEGGNDNAAVEPAQSTEDTETAAEVSEPTEDDDDALIETSKAKLIGTWTISGVDDEQLTFNEDGSGTYTGIFDKNCSFTYVVSAYHQEYSNSTEKVIALLSVSCNTGESEDITFEFRGDAEDELVFHNSDYTGAYSGVFNFDVYVKG